MSVYTFQSQLGSQSNVPMQSQPRRESCWAAITDSAEMRGVCSSSNLCNRCAPSDLPKNAVENEDVRGGIINKKREKIVVRTSGYHRCIVHKSKSRKMELSKKKANRQIKCLVSLDHGSLLLCTEISLFKEMSLLRTRQRNGCGSGFLLIE